VLFTKRITRGRKKPESERRSGFLSKGSQRRRWGPFYSPGGASLIYLNPAAIKRPMGCRHEREGDAKTNPRPLKLSREEEVRQVVQQYIDDQRAVIEKLLKWMRP
jgi:hypothetical protein